MSRGTGIIFALLCAVLFASWMALVKQSRAKAPGTSDPYADAVAQVQQRGDIIPPAVAPGLIERDEYHLVNEKLAHDVPLIEKYDHLSLEQARAELERLLAEDGPFVPAYAQAIRDEYQAFGYQQGELGDQLGVENADGIIVIYEGAYPELYEMRRRMAWLEDRIRHLEQPKYVSTWDPDSETWVITEQRRR